MRPRDRSSLLRSVPPGVGTAFWVVLPVMLSLFVYRKLVNVYFNSDDFLNLFYIVNREPLDYMLRPHGGHVLLVRNAVFWLTFQVFGAWPEFYFATVLLTHLLNVALLYLLVWRLTGNGIVSAIAAALWGICPVHGGTLGWYCVYGQVLVATVLLALLNQAVRPVSDGTRLRWRILLIWPVLLLVASTCFGIGIGITLVAPLVFFLLLPPSPQRTATCLVLCLLAASTPYLYGQALALHQAYSGPSSEGFAAAVAFEQRGVSLHQLAMVMYLGLCGLSSLVIGFIGTIDTFPPAAWLIAGVIAVLTGIVFVGTDSRSRRALLAFAVLAGGAYGIIAQGRSQFFQPETLALGAAQARYHYVATVPFAAMLGLVAAQIIAWLRLRAGAHVLLLTAWLSVAAWSYRSSAPFIDFSPNSRKETLIVINTVLKKAGQAWRVRDVFIRNYPFRAIGMLFVLNQVAFPGWAAVYTIFFPTNEVAGKHVHFVEDDPAVVRMAKKGRRTAGLIISEADLRPCEYPE